MFTSTSSRTFRAILYGGGSALLLLNAFLLVEAIFNRNFVPIVPIIAGIFTTMGLLFVVYAEQRAREDDKKSHRRIARVAHQLTTPLKNLRNDLDSILSSAQKMPAGKRLQLKKMSTRSKIVLDNIRDVFLTLQAQEGRISQTVEAHDLCELVEKTRQRVSALASARNTELQYSKKCSKSLAKVDKRLFSIALTHILENAIYYSLTPGRVDIEVSKEKRHTCITIKDRGIGISKKDATTVFQPFARGEEAEKYEPDGIGIGLVLAKTIINEFKGTITWRKKKTGTGTEFIIRLPLLPNNQTPNK